MSELHSHAGGWHVHRTMTDPDHGGLGPPTAIHNTVSSITNAVSGERPMNNVKLVLSFESGHVEAQKGLGLDGRWQFSFFTDADGSYMSCDVSEAMLRSLLAFIEAADAPAP